jgi:transcriptional regulator with XRE-family HTH domain
MSNDTQTNRRAVADLIRGRLDRLGENQRWLAQRAGMSESSLSDILNRKQDITVPQAKRLAEVEELGLTTTVILAAAADADSDDEKRLIESLGIIGPLFARLSAERKEQVMDLITVLYKKESTDARRDTGKEEQGRKPTKK